MSQQAGPMPRSLAITNARTADGRRLNVVIEDGRITALDDVGPPQREGMAALDAAGRILLSGLIEAHTHLDKNFIGLPWVRNETSAVGPSGSSTSDG